MQKADMKKEAALNSLSGCEACGAAFSCGAALSGCWCAEVTLTEEVRAGLRERYGGCLCRACLERFAHEGFPETRRENTLT
jgi:hypothetical protein